MGREETDLYFPLMVCKSWCIEQEEYMKALGQKVDSWLVAWRITNYSESPWHLDTMGQVKNVASFEF